MRDFVVVTQDVQCVVFGTKVQLVKASNVQRDSITTVQVRIRLAILVGSTPESRDRFTRAGDVSLSYVLCDFEMPLGFERRPPKRLGGYGPPIDQVPPVGSPVKPMAMTERAAANSGPKL
jgi:hypothetical protein